MTAAFLTARPALAGARFADFFAAVLRAPVGADARFATSFFFAGAAFFAVFFAAFFAGAARFALADVFLPTAFLAPVVFAGVLDAAFVAFAGVLAID